MDIVGVLPFFKSATMNAYIETIISLVLIFFIFSTIAYVIQEIVSINLKYRGRMLFNSISKLLDDDKITGVLRDNKKPLVAEAPYHAIQGTLTEELYKHPQIGTLIKKPGNIPSFIPSSNFAMAIIDIIKSKSAVPLTGNTFTDFISGLQGIQNSNPCLYQLLNNLLDVSAGSLNKLMASIEKWFNDYMDRVSGWYQTHIVTTLRIIAVGIALFFNINVIKMSKIIFKSGAMRASLVAVATEVADHPDNYTAYYTNHYSTIAEVYKLKKDSLINATTNPAQKQAINAEYDKTMDSLTKKFTAERIGAITSLTDTLASTGLPLGWKSNWEKDFIVKSSSGNTDYVNSFVYTFYVLLGWTIAAGCISMGAPFWFDLLIKLVNLRRSGIKPDSDASKKNN